MAADRSAQPVDVLAVIDEALLGLRAEWHRSGSPRTMRAHYDLAEVGAAVAELIEAAEFASNVCAELYAKYQLKVGPFASQAQVANGKLRAALARVQGGAA